MISRRWSWSWFAVLAAPLAAQWQTLPPVPCAPRPLQAFALGDRVVAIGTPWVQAPESCEVAVLDPDGRWRTVDAPPLSCREQLLVRAVGGRLLVFGGREPKSGRWCDDGALLDPVAGAWKPMPRCPVAGRHAAAVADDGNRLAFVAGLGEAPRLDGAVFDVAAGRWQRLPDLPVAARAFALLAFAGGRLVVWGGWQPGAAGRATPLADGAVLAPGDERWQPLPPAPAPYGSLPGTIASDGGSVLVFARTSGWIADGARLELATKQWTALPRREDFGISPGICHAFDGHLFVYSGRLGASGKPAHDAFAWHQDTRAWQPVQLPEAFVPRETPGQADAGARLAVLGGGRPTGLVVADGATPAQPDLGNCYGDGFVVDIGTGKLQYVPEGPLGKLEQPALAFCGDALVVIGGHRDQREWLLSAARFRLPR